MHLTRQLGARGAAVFVVAVLLGAIGFLPLFGGLGYEHALASGLIVPSAAAIATAFELSHGAPRAPLASVLRGVSNGALLSVVAFVTALFHGCFVGFCDFWGGARGFFLTAAMGAVLGGVWGAYVADRARGKKRRRAWCVTLGLAAPLFGVLLSVWRFYSSPMIFAFDPFFGYFSGTLYDTVIDAGTPLLTYRLGTMATLTFALSLASLLERSEAGALVVAPLKGAGPRATLTVVTLAASVAVTAYGPALGHWQTTQTIRRDLAGFRSGSRCDVVYPDALREEEISLLVKDCDEEMASVEAVWGARGPRRVTAFFFRDAGDKKRLMGAGDTYIAKPWRDEAYLQMAAYPHPVLGHELAHVVAGGVGRGPFRVAGSLGGWWPNPGLIEGVAVAVSPDDDELTDAAWARAMMDLNILPPVERVFSMEFLGANSAKSYTLAGAFVRWIMKTYGAPIVRRWYHGENLGAVVGASWDEMDRRFREDLAKYTLSSEAVAYAKSKFQPLPHDRLGRPLRDLRLSVIEACNFRCPYCMPAERVPDDYGFDAATRLSFDEIETLVSGFVRLGVNKLRITGGEPLLRKHLPDLIARLATIPGIDDLALTTNRYVSELETDITTTDQHDAFGQRFKIQKLIAQGQILRPFDWQLDRLGTRGDDDVLCLECLAVHHNRVGSAESSAAVIRIDA